MYCGCEWCVSSIFLFFAILCGKNDGERVVGKGGRWEKEGAGDVYSADDKSHQRQSDRRNHHLNIKGCEVLLQIFLRPLLVSSRIVSSGLNRSLERISKEKVGGGGGYVF